MPDGRSGVAVSGLSPPLAPSVCRAIPGAVSVDGDRPDVENARLDAATRWVGRRAVVAFSGDIDMSTGQAFRDAIEEAVGSGAMELWVDLTAVDFMDSTGLHALVAARSRTRELDIALTVICPAGPVRRTILIGGLEDSLPLCANRTEAQYEH
jgi:anti-sigma B factor antagonist